MRHRRSRIISDAAGELVDGCGDFVVAFGDGVLVAQCGVGGGVAESGHGFFGGCAGGAVWVLGSAPENDETAGL